MRYPVIAVSAEKIGSQQLEPIICSGSMAHKVELEEGAMLS